MSASHFRDAWQVHRLNVHWSGGSIVSNCSKGYVLVKDQSHGSESALHDPSGGRGRLMLVASKA